MSSDNENRGIQFSLAFVIGLATTAPAILGLLGIACVEMGWRFCLALAPALVFPYLGAVVGYYQGGRWVAFGYALFGWTLGFWISGPSLLYFFGGFRLD